jgi:ATP:corrinoid adenosyltransferase
MRADISPYSRQAAHLVTEMRPIKHPYEQGIVAQKGVEI